MDAVEQSLRDKANELLQRAYRLQVAGHLALAIQSYTASIEVLPTAEAHCFRGWAYSQQGKYYEAIAECRTSYELDPEFGNPYNDVGAYLIQLGQLDDAIPYLELAMRAKRYLTPHFPHYNYGRILERKGLWFEALKEYKRSLDICKDYDLAKDAYYRLQALLN